MVPRLRKYVKKRHAIDALGSSWYASLRGCSMASNPTRQSVLEGTVASPRHGAVGVIALDELDRRLIRALQRDGRRSFRVLAQDLGVAGGTLRARYRRLVAANALQVTAITNPAVLGFESAMVGVRTTRSPQDTAQLLLAWPEATYVVVTAGQFDLLVELVCRDRHELLTTIGRLRGVEGVASTESFMYMELSKQLYDWGSAAADVVAGDGNAGALTEGDGPAGA